MRLSDLIPDADELLALDPEELGVRMLPVLAAWPSMHQLDVVQVMELIAGREDSQFARAHYPIQKRAEIREALAEAWAWLEGQGLLIYDSRYVGDHGVRKLGRRARRIVKEKDYSRVAAIRKIPKETLHSSIREDVWSLFLRGKYDTAVFEAMKAVEVAVRDAAGLASKEIGTNLMRLAFDPKQGPLTDMNIDISEREARSALFAGAIGSYKNPQSHRHVALDNPDEAAEIILLASHLLRIVDTRADVKAGRS